MYKVFAGDFSSHGELEAFLNEREKEGLEFVSFSFNFYVFRAAQLLRGADESASSDKEADTDVD